MNSTQSELASSSLEKLYEIIREKMEHTSDLENLDVAKGAVPLLAMSLYLGLNSYEQLTISDRLSGSCIVPFTFPRNRKTEIQLAKIKIGNVIHGIEVVQQFEDCKGCIKIPGCDKVEAGSILFKEKMCIGYTCQDVSYESGLGVSSGDCEFRFVGHHPSKDLYVIANHLHYCYITPQVVSWLPFSYQAETLNQPIARELSQLRSVVQEVGKANSAIDCASIIQDAYFSIVE